MKILSVTDAFPPETWGGAEISCYELGLTLTKLGLDFSVLTFYRKPHREQQCFSEIYCVVHENSSIPFFRDFQRWEIGALKMAAKLKKILSTNRFDIIHAHGPMSAYSLLWAKLLGTSLPKLVFTMRNPWPACPFGRGYCLTDYLRTRLCLSSLKGACVYYFGENPFWMKIMGISPYVAYKTVSYQFFKSTLKLFDRIVTVSHFLKYALTQRTSLQENMVSVIYNGIDVEKFAFNKNSKNEKLILFIGRLSKDKGVQYLIQAFHMVLKDHPDYKLAIIGYGPYEKTLRDVVKKLHLVDKVSFLGFIPPNQIHTHFLQAEIFVHPSVYPEPFGRVIVEAMAAGKPIVATRVGGVPEIVSDGEGLLVDPLDHRGLADAINYLIDNPRVAREMGRRGQLKARSKYSIERMTRDYLKLYEDLLRF